MIVDDLATAHPELELAGIRLRSLPCAIVPTWYREVARASWHGSVTVQEHDGEATVTLLRISSHPRKRQVTSIATERHRLLALAEARAQSPAFDTEFFSAFLEPIEGD